MKIPIKNLLLAGAVAGLSGSAYAIPELIITDELTHASTTVVGTSPDVAFGGILGNWNVLIAVGESGSPFGKADLDVDASYMGAPSPLAALEIEFSDTGFTTPGGLVSAIGGTIGPGSSGVSLTTYVDPSDALFGQADTLTSQVFAGAGTFGSTVSSGVSISGTYSLTEIAVITNSSANSLGSPTSFDSSLSVPDSGTTAILLGIGLLGVSIAARRLMTVKT